MDKPANYLRYSNKIEIRNSEIEVLYRRIFNSIHQTRGTSHEKPWEKQVPRFQANIPANGILRRGTFAASVSSSTRFQNPRSGKTEFRFHAELRSSCTRGPASVGKTRFSISRLTEFESCPGFSIIRASIIRWLQLSRTLRGGYNVAADNARPGFPRAHCRRRDTRNSKFGRKRGCRRNGLSIRRDSISCADRFCRPCRIIADPLKEIFVSSWWNGIEVGGMDLEWFVRFSWVMIFIVGIVCSELGMAWKNIDEGVRWGKAKNEKT